MKHKCTCEDAADRISLVTGAALSSFMISVASSGLCGIAARDACADLIIGVLHIFIGWENDELQVGSDEALKTAEQLLVELNENVLKRMRETYIMKQRSEHASH